MRKPRIMTPYQRALFKKLTAFQQRLVVEHLAGKSQLQAYRSAQPEATGTDASAKVTVCVTLKKPKVVAYLDAMKEDMVSDSIMSREESLERLSTLARGNFSDMVEFKTASVGRDDDGEKVLLSVWRIKDSTLQDPEKLATISELSATAQGLKMKLHNPVVAIQQLAAMCNWNTPTKVDLLSTDGSMTPAAVSPLDTSKLSDSALREIVEAYESADSDS